ncbi:MAG: MlaA family lipoprotein [Victivallales bacterium]
MKFSLYAFLLAVMLAVTGCSSTSGNKAAGGEAGIAGKDSAVAVEAPASVIVAAEEKVHEDAVAGQDENPAGAEHEFPDLTEEYGGRDPIEGFNRSMFAVNKFGLRYVVQPIVIFWGSLIPRHGIECFNRFTDNLAFPKRTFSSLCQAKFKYAGIDTSRFLINVTLGIAGFYDPALNWFDMEVQDEDFGQAFAVWGIGPGCVLHLPVVGQANVRDGVGKIFDYAFDPKTYIYGGQSFTILNESTHRYREMETFYRANYDPYELLKRLYASERYFKINDYDRRERMEEYQKRISSEDEEILLPEPDPLLHGIVVRGFKSQGSHIDTLRLGMVDIQNDNESMWVDASLWNTDFFNQGSIRTVEVGNGKSGMPYKVWCQKQDDAPLAVVIPGLGSHFTGAHVSSVSEILFNQGYTVVALSSVFSWEFMSTAASVPVPGYVPSDAEDVRTAIAAIIRDLENKGLFFQTKILVGYSLGGMHALFIGAKEKADPKLKINRFVAINPPVDAAKSVPAIDEMGLAWKKWPREQVFERGVMAAGKYLSISRKHYKPYEEPEMQDEVKGADAPVGNVSVPAPATDGTVQSGGDKEKTKHEPLPFSDVEAQALIAYSYKITLDEIILSIVRNNMDMNCFKSPCSWGNRTDFYRETGQLSFADYNRMFLFKYCLDVEKRAVPADEIYRNSSLGAIEDFLRDEPDVFVVHSSNDFLESPADRRWLRKTMGDRCVFYNVGGHLGDLYLAGLQCRLATLAGELKKQANTPVFAGGGIAVDAPGKTK